MAYEESLERSMAIFTVEGATEVAVKDRIAAAEALGRGGDPRLEHLEHRLLEVPFVEHRGYQEKKHWDAEGWAARKKESWNEPVDWAEQLLTPNRPVTGVSWYEAMAYCAWLSVQRSEEIQLPPEKLWEASATPAKGQYPWGEAEPDEDQANFALKFLEPNVGSPTPVGVCPAGNGPLGHCDLAGNIWEWCEEVWSQDEPERRVLRGGSWASTAVNLRAAYRFGDPASDRSGFVGFRLAVAPPQS